MEKANFRNKDSRKKSFLGTLRLPSLPYLQGGRRRYTVLWFYTYLFCLLLLFVCLPFLMCLIYAFMRQTWTKKLFFFSLVLESRTIIHQSAFRPFGKFSLLSPLVFPLIAWPPRNSLFCHSYRDMQTNKWLSRLINIKSSLSDNMA